jgi:hypothetical protein
MESLFSRYSEQKTSKKSQTNNIVKSCLTAFYFLLSHPNLGVQDTIAPISHIEKEDTTLEDIKTKYNIDIVSTEFSETGSIRYAPAKNNKEFGEILQNVLSQYSPLLVRMSGIKKIVLTENLRYHDNKKCPRKESCTLKKCRHISKINGIQNTQEHIFFTNTTPDVKDTPLAVYISRVSHHELYHTIDDTMLPDDEDRLFWAKENRCGKKEYA